MLEGLLAAEEARFFLAETSTTALLGSFRAAAATMPGDRRAAEYRRHQTCEGIRHALARRIDQEPLPAFMEKRRSGGQVSGDALVRPVKGRVAVIIDDMIGTGTTPHRAAVACCKAGATAA